MTAEVRLRESIPQHSGSADFPLGDYDAALSELLTEMSLVGPPAAPPRLPSAGPNGKHNTEREAASGVPADPVQLS